MIKASRNPPILFSWRPTHLERFCARVDALPAAPTGSVPAPPPWLPTAAPLDSEALARAMLVEAMNQGQPGMAYDLQQGILVRIVPSA